MSESTIKRSMGIRLSIIAGLTLILLIPAFMLQLLIHERKNRRDSAASEISDKWGGTQTIIGPVLSVPFNENLFDVNGEILQTTTRYAHFLPENLSIEGKIYPELKYRGIYEIVVYNCRLKLSGVFSRPDFAKLKIEAKDIFWKDALVSLGISDMKGIKSLITINWNGSELPAAPGIETNDVIGSGISANIALPADGAIYDFSTELDLNGSSGLFFAPVGKETRVAISSDWKNPSFTGEFLPDEREVTSEGFNAKWKVLHLNRNYPQNWIGVQNKIAASSFGVNLLLAVDEYQKTMRTAKYALMFISLTFLAFFMIELLSRKAIHPIQYLLIGLALLVFYTLLLSISEHLVFNLAYLIASAGIILLIAMYAKFVLTIIARQPSSPAYWFYYMVIYSSCCSFRIMRF